MKKKAEPSPQSRPEPEVEAMQADIARHLMSSLGTDPQRPDATRCFKALAHTVRDHMVDQWVRTMRSYYDREAKRIYYLSLEFLLGRLLRNCLLNLGLEDRAAKALGQMGFDLGELEEKEADAGLGNGGLGRLAACFLDSMATLGLPAYGYGILYDYGMFFQRIVDGFQVESPDAWLRFGCPWEIARPENLYVIKLGGRVHSFRDERGRLQHRWVDAEEVLAMPCDLLIPGYANGNVINLRLWSARSTRDFNLDYFQKGDYVEAVQAKVQSENISKVLYPSEEVLQGRQLRLKQEYFFVAATFQDIMRRFQKGGEPFDRFPDRVAIQLNDTHPAVAIPELMRLLVDEEELDWERAWDICVRTFGYTNHTIMPEALETWPVEMLESILPRHLEIIREINRRFLAEVAAGHPGDVERLQRMSIFEEAPEHRVRMANLAVVGSHRVNGVSQVHTDIIKERVFKDFHEMFPGRFLNQTNGITPRRWLAQANPALASLISQHIGPGWLTDLERLKELTPLAEDPGFRARWRQVKRRNKERLAEIIQGQNHLAVPVDSLFDVQVKRIHEYKRQMLNILQVIARYWRIVEGGERPQARTVIFGGKAAPGYRQAKLIIKLINEVGRKVNSDHRTEGLLRVVFLANYNVSLAERIIPGAELSEQISTAGTEASGTGNMKFALNGALTIGTLDGANIEIMEEVGRKNIFICGLDAAQAAGLSVGGYDPWAWYHGDPELRRALDMIGNGEFSPGQPDLFRPLVQSLLEGGDRFLVLADFADYCRAQAEVDRIYQDHEEWTRRSIMNVANMGKFSSDATIKRYAREIWNVRPVGIKARG